MNRTHIGHFLCAALTSIGVTHVASAQAPRPLTLQAAVRFALEHHPSLTVAGANAEAARADIDAARAARLPSLDALAQANRATGNVVAGSLFPMSGLPGVSGPPGNHSPAGGSWGTTGALVSGLPITGLLRTSRTLVVRDATLRAAEAKVDATKLQVAARAAAAFLEARAATEQARVAEAGRRRALALDTITRALAAEGLRPGADSARSASEVANADIEVARAVRLVAIGNVRLADAIGAASAVVDETEQLPLAAYVAANGVGNQSAGLHPLEREAEALTAAAVAERSVTATAWWPSVDLLGAMWARGSGEAVAGVSSLPANNGLTPNVRNWAIGLVASWPLLGAPGIHAQQRRVDAELSAARARATIVSNDISAERQEALASLNGAITIAARTRVGVTAARAVLEQTVARYRAGLTSIVDVADADRQLVTAEATDARAQIEMIAARLVVARAAGDLDGFLALLSPLSSR